MKKPRLFLRLLIAGHLMLASLGFRSLPFFKGIFYRIYSNIGRKCGVVRITTNDGIALAIDLKDDVIATFLLEYGEWEPGVTRMMKERIRPGMHVVDIGAHVGYSTTLMSKLVGPAGSVTAFEPEAYNYALLVENAGKIKNCALVNSGVSDTEGVSTLYLAEGNLGGHSMRAATSMPVEIRTVILDDFLDDKPISFIKMDIEGNEPLALRGMQRILTRKEIVLMFEYTPALIGNKEDLFAGLRSLGFSMYELTPAEGELVPFDAVPSTPDGANANILCIKGLQQTPRI
jgi:FkbM family methyltransferase